MQTAPHLRTLTHFLDHSPTSWHAIEQIKIQLNASGFKELEADAIWDLIPGESYYLVKNGSSLCAFTLPSGLPRAVLLAASHTDSPALKLRPQPEVRKCGSILISSEVYGSPLLSSWFNRDLGIAGRIFYTSQNNSLEETLITLDRYPLTIPQLAIHLDRDVNDKGFFINRQEHLYALAGLDKHFTEQSYLESVISEQLEIKSLIAHDLFLYPLEKARLTGFNQEFVSSYRLDSLASVQAIVTGLTHAVAPAKETIKMALFSNHEEIGSSTAQGADSPFFLHLLERLLMGLGCGREHFLRLLNCSLCLSIDLAHATHPNFIEKHDPLHPIHLGKGIVIKYNAQERYATDGKLAATLFRLANQAGIPLQLFSSRSDIPCGSTIGPIHASLTGIPTVDIGCGQLSMHSARELMACQDHLDLCRLMVHFFQQTRL